MFSLGDETGAKVDMFNRQSNRCQLDLLKGMQPPTQKTTQGTVVSNLVFLLKRMRLQLMTYSIAKFVYLVRDALQFPAISKPELEVEGVEVPTYAQYHWKVYTELGCQN